MCGIITATGAANAIKPWEWKKRAIISQPHNTGKMYVHSASDATSSVAVRARFRWRGIHTRTECEKRQQSYI